MRGLFAIYRYHEGMVGSTLLLGCAALLGSAQSSSAQSSPAPQHCSFYFPLRHDHRAMTGGLLAAPETVTAGSPFINLVRVEDGDDNLIPRNRLRDTWLIVSCSSIVLMPPPDPPIPPVPPEPT